MLFFVFVIFVSFDVWFGIFVYFETVRPPCVMTPNETQDQRLRKLSEFAASVVRPFWSVPVGEFARAVTSNQMCRPQYSNGSAAPVDRECYAVNETGTIRR